MSSHKTARKSDQTTNLGVRSSNLFGRAINLQMKSKRYERLTG